MHPEEPAVAGAAQRLAARFGAAPRVAVVLGSGLGPVADRLEQASEAPFQELGLPESAVAGHAGRVRVGTLSDTSMAVVQGRLHLYEGHHAGVVVRLVRALHRWGVQHLVLTCSVGGITEGLDPGTTVLIEDHLNFQHSNPLIGPAFGTRFPDLGQAYDPEMCAALKRAAAGLGQRLPTGVLAAMPGPTYETPAEVRMLRTLGADVVGMSTVPEVMAAAEVGLRTAVVAVVSNRAAGLGGGPLTHDEVTENAVQVADRLGDLLAEASHGFR
jgi:inosine/guanosine/xanthosine phosphorylase family protein